MPKVDWTWFIVGLLFGWMVVPMLLGMLGRGRAAA